ncbi:MAG: helix-turn-helix transcriptional regulator [Clostridia bacterium]|nr:helix-turn-helix transcriptional regulator [Clostridia bacterium]
MEAKDVGNRIKELREKKKMTQYALANQSGVSPTYIYQLERGEKSPTIEYLAHICWGLGVTLADFFKDPDEQEDKISSLSAEQKKLLNQFLQSL